MDSGFPSAHMEQTAPLSKRRRFAPFADQCFFAVNADGTIDNQTFDSPLLLQLSGQPTPEEIERELLQVGMRINKPANKTTAFTPRPFFNMHRLSPATQAALCSGPLNRQPLSTATFCGINLAALAHISTTPIEEQKMWSYTTSHKRGYEGESDSDDQEFMPATPSLGGDAEAPAIPVDYFNIDFDGSGDVSPFTRFEETVTPAVPGRRLAKPKSRLPRQPAAQQQNAFNPFAQLQMPQQVQGTQWMGHRRMTSCGVEANISLNGFGEPSFLSRRDDIDMDCS